MRAVTARSAFITTAAIMGAVLWGAVELLALQWSRFHERLRLLRLASGF